MLRERIIKIAIADDHVLIRHGIINVISSFDTFKIILEVDNGKILLEKLNNSKDIPDICIIDINMPEMNGYETLKKLKEKWPDIKVLVLSMYNNIFGVVKLLREGANGYLLKTCNPKELQKALLNMYDAGYYYPDFISGKMIHLLQNKNKDFPILTDKEIAFLTLCSTEMTYKQIADILCVSPRTIDKFSRVLFEKLNVNTRTALVTFAVNMGLPCDTNYKHKII